MVIEIIFLGEKLVKKFNGVRFPSYFIREDVELTDKEKQELDKISAPDSVKEILLGRGFSIEQIDRYINASEEVFNPDLILNMNKAGDIILESMRNGDGVGIFGDYDTDGATSTSQLYMYLRDLVKENSRYFSAPLAWRIGKREGGYGPYPAGTKELFDEGCKTLVILDSGTVANAQIASAREHGFKNIIVIDHHQPGNNWEKPDALIVNPHQPEDSSGFTDLCTAGLVWCLLKHFNNVLSKDDKIESPDIDNYAVLAAVGSIVDMMSMSGMNRGLVRHGLKLEHLSDGIQALKAAIGLEEEIDSAMCGWKIGPCINSGGRIDDSSLGTMLFSQSDDDFSAEMSRDEIASKLHTLNEHRKEMKNEYIAQSEEQLENLKPENGVIILENNNWHPGLVGLVASEPLRRFGLPCIAIGENGKGSARSTPAFDIGHMLIEARKQGLLLSGGGHQAAGGLSLNPERRDEFFKYVSEKSKHVLPEPLIIDMEITCSDIGEHFIAPLEQAMEPIGQQNPLPLFTLNADVLRLGFTKSGNPKLRVVDETGEATLFAWCKEGEFYDFLKSLAPNDEGVAQGIQFVLRITHIPFTTMIIEDVIYSPE